MVIVAPFVCAVVCGLIFLTIIWWIFKWTVIGTLILIMFVIELLKEGVSRLVSTAKPKVPSGGGVK